MKKIIILRIFIFLVASCKEKHPEVIFRKFDETAELEAQQNHNKKRKIHWFRRFSVRFYAHFSRIRKTLE